jgi:hypothetical protein
MTMQYIPASVDTFLTLHTAYPSLGLRLAALPATTRVWVKDAACFVHPSANGKFWDYELGGTGPNLTVNSAARWIVPLGFQSGTTSTAVSANNFRGLTYRMPNHKARDVTRLSFQTNGATSGTGGTDAFDLRVYLLGPDYKPLAIAPIHVWKYNAAGTGGAGALSLVIGGGLGTTAFDLPASITANLPGLFVLGMIHAFVPTTMPALYVPSLTGMSGDLYPRALTGSDPSASANYDRTPAWQWAETFSAGAATVWGSTGSPDMTTNLCPSFNMKLAA